MKFLQRGPGKNSKFERVNARQLFAQLGGSGDLPGMRDSVQAAGALLLAAVPRKAGFFNYNLYRFPLAGIHSICPR